MAEFTDGGDLVAGCLAALGITHLFGLHGGHLDPIFQACADHGLRLVDVRHEAAAGHAADAYARQTGRCGVAVATAGPSFTNILTALTQAHLDAVPLLVVIGAPPLRDVERWPLQGGFDQLAMARPVCKWTGQVTQPALIPHLISHAVLEAESGRPGPVCLEIPIDVLFARVGDTPAMPAAAVGRPRPAPAPAQTARILDTLMAASRPAILCGGGMLYAEATGSLRAFAELTGIPVYANNKARGVLPADHALCAGPQTGIPLAEASGLGTPDVLLTLGARFGMFTEPGLLGSARIPPDDCTIIQVDVHGPEFGRVRPVHMPVLADCGETVRALLEGAAGRRWPDWSGWADAIHRLTDWHEQAFEDELDGGTGVRPYAAVREVVRVLGDDVLLCADGGEASFWTELVSRPRAPGMLMSHGYLGCLGIGLPFAIGAQIAHPGRRVAVVTGDGSVGFNFQEFDTLARHSLPVVVVVLNNKAWGMCVHGQQAMYGNNRLVGTTLGEARYDQAADGLGCHGEYAERLDDIAPAIRRALDSGLPACVNVLVDLGATPLPGAAAADRSISDEVVLPYYDG